MPTEEEYQKSLDELGIQRNYFTLENLPEKECPTRGRRKSKYDCETVYFSSCDEMIDKLSRGVKDHKWNHHNYDLSDYTTPGRLCDWAHGKLGTYEKTLEYLKEGKVLDSVMAKANDVYQKLVESPAIDNLMARAATFKRRRVYSEEGTELCIDRVLCGDPAHWGKNTKGKKNTLIKLGVNISGNAGEDESLFNNLSAVAGVVTDLLTRAGFAVQLDVCSTGYDAKSTENIETIIVTLKGAEEVLDLQRVYSVGASGFFRCWIFQVLCNVLKGPRMGWGLGSACGIGNSLREALGYDYIIDSEFVNGQSRHINIEKMFNQIIEHHV